MADFFGKGISIASGFDVNANAPLDNRSVCSTIRERDKHVTYKRAYVGMEVYVESVKKVYRYDGSEWIDTTVETGDFVTQEDIDVSIADMLATDDEVLGAIDDVLNPID